MDPNKLIGPTEQRRKEIVVMSSKDVNDSQRDVVTSQNQKKIIVKDLVNLMKSDPRLSHKPLLYQLQNNFL